MKKQATKKWLLPIVVLMVLIATVGMVMAGCKQEPQQQPDGPATPGSASALYWNLDREQYIDPDTGLSLREKDENGKFMMRFFVDGQILNLEIVDKQLVNFIDSKALWGLVFDGNGVVTDVVEAKDAATEIAKEFFVVSQKDGVLTLNSSQLMNGMKVEVNVTEKTKIYNVDPSIGEVGAEIVPELMDKVYVYGTSESEATHVFVSTRPAKSDAYFRVDNMERLYNASTGQTTRVPDENGVYTIPLAWEGEIVQVKTKSKALCNEIDAYEAQSCAAFGLKFDDEGYAIEELELTLATRTTRRAENFTVTAIDGNNISLEMMWSTSAKLGQTDSITLADDCDIFLCETNCAAKFCGERVDSLQVGDRIYAFANMDGEIVLVYIAKRLVDWPIYYWTNYIGTTKGVSNAKKDDKGYYIFENMYGNGKVQTLKTKDDALAAKISGFWARNAGLIVENGIIKDACELSCISGRANIGTPRYVTGTIGPIWQFAGEADPTDLSNHMLTEDLRVYDFTTSYGAKPGKATDLRIGDKVHAYRHPNDMMRLILVTQRWEKDAPLHVNLDMQWDYTNLCSKRQPDADGYYVFKFAVNGKEVTGKTKDVKLVNYVDKERFISLKIDKNGIIKEAHPATYAFEFGASVLGYVYYDSTNPDGTVNYYAGTGNYGNKEYYRTSTVKITKKTKIYNTSATIVDHVGEITKLKKGDYIQGYYNVSTGEIQEIHVRERKVISKLYMNTTTYSRVDGVTTRPTDADGYYVFEVWGEGKKYTFKTKDVVVASSLDSRSSLPFGLELKGDIIIKDYDTTNVMGVQGWVAWQWDLLSINVKKGTAKIIQNKKEESSYGKITEIELSPTIKCYNMVSGSPNYGKEQMPKPGDRLNIFANGKWTSEYVFIVSEHGREKGAWSDCAHCGQNVYWEAYNGTFVPDAGGEHGHYFMPKNDYWSSPRAVGYTAEQLAADETLKQWDIVFDLNGKTFDARGGFVTVNSNFILIDSVGGGTLQSNYKSATATSPAVINVMPGATVTVDGAKLTYADGSNSKQLGGLISAESGAVTIKNATIEGAKLDKSAIYVGNGGALTIENSAITAKKTTGAPVYMGEGSTLELKGKVALSGLHLNAGMLLDVSKLTEGSAIAVDAEGVFTTECENVEAAKAYFTALYSEEKQIDIVGNTLSVGTFFNPLTQELVLSENGTAYCPICDKEATWTALTDAAVVAAAEHAHYYLAADINYTGSDAFITVPAGTNVCLHLNGHKLTAAQAIRTTGGNADVFGKGSVNGNDAVISIETGAVTLHTGTYNAQKVVAAISAKGGKLNVLKRAAVVSAGETAITVGAAEEANAELNVQEATVIGGITAADLNTEKGKTSIVKLDNAKIEGTVKVGKISELKLIGEAQMQLLDLLSGMKVTLTELSREVKIAVLADGIFTEAAENAEDYLTVFTAGTGYLPITVREQALSTFHSSKIDNSDLVFEEGTQKAKCSLCGEVVEWIAITGEEIAVELEAGKHYYLANDITVDAQAAVDAGLGGYLYAANMGKSGQTCLHLNGKSLVVSNHRAIFANVGSLNIMGNGLVAGEEPYGTGSAITLNTSAASSTVNLFGGTYTKAASEKAAKSAVISIGANGGTVNIYGTATIDGTDLVTTDNALVRIGGDSAQNAGTVNMHSGVIKNGANTTSGGNVFVSNAYATFNMYGGTITGGKALKNGGNILAYGNVNIHGGLIENGISETAWGGNIFMTGTDIAVTMTGGTISGGQALDSGNGMGGNMFIREGAALNISGGEIKDGKSGVVGGNAYVQYANMTMTGGIISGGQSVSGGNLNFYSSADTPVTITISGGLIKDGVATSNGGNINLTGAGTNFTLAGNARISNGTAPRGGNMYITRAGQIISGGIIENGNSTDGGANIYATVDIEITGDVQILGGITTKNYRDGGSIYGQGLIVVSGGKISGGKSEQGYGGNIAGTGGITITGGIIENGTAVIGGNIYAPANGGKLTISGGVIKDGKAPNGGNIAIYKEGEITGGEILGGTSTSTGGSIYMGSSVLTISGGTISGGNAGSSYGGNIYLYRAQLTMTGGTIKDGKASLGGNVMANNHDDSKVTILGGTIANGKADDTQCGGNLLVYKDTLIADATFIGGQAGYGGSIATFGGTLTVYNTVIDGGKAVSGTPGGNIYVSGASSTLILAGNTQVKNGTSAAEIGGDVYQSNGALWLAHEATVGQIRAKAPAVVNVCDGWTGTATVEFDAAYAAGEAVATTVAKVITVTLDDAMNITGVADGGNFTGTLQQADGVKFVSDGSAAVKAQ